MNTPTAPRAWKKISSRTAYKNPWLTVREDKVIQPNGEESIYGVVEGREFAMAIPQADPDTFYMVNQYRYPLGSYSLEFPAGGLKDGENAADALSRELQEEAKLHADKLTELGCLDVAGNFTNMHFYVYLAEGLTPTSPRDHDPSEGEITLQKLTLQDIKDRIKDGTIKDSHTIAAFNLYLLR